MKNCNICKKTKELTEFAKAFSGKFGVKAVCKLCIADIQRLTRETNPGKVKEYNRLARERQTSRGCVLYKIVHEGIITYIGVTTNPSKRARQHRTGDKWTSKKEGTLIEIGIFGDDRELAIEVETKMIKKYQPEHNQLCK